MKDPVTSSVIAKDAAALNSSKHSFPPTLNFKTSLFSLPVRCFSPLVQRQLPPQGVELTAVCVCRVAYRRGSTGLWGFSWLSEHLKGRLLFGGSSKWCRPRSGICSQASLTAGKNCLRGNPASETALNYCTCTVSVGIPNVGNESFMNGRPCF